MCRMICLIFILNLFKLYYANEIALTMELSKDFTISQDSLILFDDEIIDTDSAFEKQFGAYQCPRSGLYSFHWTLHAPSGRAWASLYKSGEVMKIGPLTAEIGGLRWSGSSSMSSIVECNQGEWVYLRALGYPNPDSCNKIEAEYSSITAFWIGDFESTDAFTAYLSENTVIQSTSSNIPYDTASPNIGEMYDNGFAECKTDGVFVFTVSSNIASDFGGTRLYKNNNNYLNVEINNMNRHGSGSNTIGTATGTRIVECFAGERFSLRSEFAPRTFVAHDSAWSAFRITDPNPVAFSVQLGANNEYIDGARMSFGDVIVNKGNGYIPAFGSFLCPDNALYAFFWSVMTVSENYQTGRAAEARLMVNRGSFDEEAKSGPKTGQVTLPGSSYSKSSSTQAVIRCEPNMAVFVQAVISNAERQTYDQANTAFSGFRLASQ